MCGSLTHGAALPGAGQGFTPSSHRARRTICGNEYGIAGSAVAAMAALMCACRKDAPLALRRYVLSFGSHAWHLRPALVWLRTAMRLAVLYADSPRSNLDNGWHAEGEVNWGNSTSARPLIRSESEIVSGEEGPCHHGIVLVSHLLTIPYLGASANQVRFTQPACRHHDGVGQGQRVIIEWIMSTLDLRRYAYALSTLANVVFACCQTDTTSAHWCYSYNLELACWDHA